MFSICRRQVWPACLVDMISSSTSFEWTYELFCAFWPAEELGCVDKHWFKIMYRFEKLHAISGSRVKDRSKRK